MYALTIHQPYAHLIVTPQDELPEGAVQKRVENRSWVTKHRGPPNRKRGQPQEGGCVDGKAIWAVMERNCRHGCRLDKDLLRSGGGLERDAGPSRICFERTRKPCLYLHEENTR